MMATTLDDEAVDDLEQIQKFSRLPLRMAIGDSTPLHSIPTRRYALFVRQVAER